MKNLGRLKLVLELARDFEVSNANKTLEEGVKKTTKNLLSLKPDTTYEELISNLLLSAKESYIHTVSTEGTNNIVDMFMGLVDMIVKECGEPMEKNEEIILRSIIKDQLATSMINKSFEISLKAVTEIWTGMKGMEL